MEFIDARRLTGPSIIADGPGAILDVHCKADEAEAFAKAWKRNVLKMHEALDWRKPVCVAKTLLGGVSVAFSAPIDALYAASAINEWAWAVTAAELGEAIDRPNFDATLEEIKAAAKEESNPALLRLQSDAKTQGKTMLWDDDFVSLGLGRYSETWGVRDIPEDIHWDQFEDVPIGLVTGTNGKTTTVRLATNIARAANMNVGLSSTDWIAVNDRIIDRGDWSGPGGARKVLREQDVDIAILESARGGLLRRGLGVEKADAALITNIAEDHLGDFGSQNLAELLDIKWIVSRPVRRNGRLILNADDQLLREKAKDYRGELVWFGLDEENEIIRTAVNAGGLAFIASDDELFMLEKHRRVLISAAADIPITMKGAARHNVANALAAAALSYCMGLSLDDIRAGLCSMRQDDNPGRCNIYDVDGVKVLVDFAHNPAAMSALFDMARAIPAGRRALCFGQAGDRPDGLIEEMTRDAWQIGLDHVFVSELADYHRGREHGDVFTIIRDALLVCGADAATITHNELELESFMAAMQWAQPNDLIIMLALGGAAPIQAKLEALGAEQSQ